MQLEIKVNHQYWILILVIVRACRFWCEVIRTASEVVFYFHGDPGAPADSGFSLERIAFENYFIRLNYSISPKLFVGGNTLSFVRFVLCKMRGSVLMECLIVRSSNSCSLWKRVKKTRKVRLHCTCYSGFVNSCHSLASSVGVSFPRKPISAIQ